MWLLPVLLDGLKYRDIHLREELRLGRLLSIRPWTSEQLELRDFGHFPWEEDKADAPAPPQKTPEEIERENEEILKMIHQSNG